MSELQSAAVETKADDLIGKYMTFLISDVIYGVELLHVKEIIKIQPITYVPHLPPYLKGITNLRGGIVPVIDVRLRLDQEEKEYDDKTCIIIVDFEDTMVGLIVDSVSEVVTLDNADLSAPPRSEDLRGRNYLQAFAELPEKIVLILDCERFLDFGS